MRRPATAVRAALLIGVLFGFVRLAGAVSFSWNTCEGGANNTCNVNSSLALPESPRTSTGSNANLDLVFTFAAIGNPAATLGARAFSTTSLLGTGIILKRQLNIFDPGGLGAGPEGSPEHSVDNAGVDELIVFALPTDGFKPLSFSIGYKNTDADISTWIGGTGGGPNDVLNLFLTGTFDWTGTALTSLGYVKQDFLDVNVGDVKTFTSNATGRYLVIGAKNEADNCPSNCKDGGEDKFKILQVVAESPGRPPTSLPVPGTLVLLGCGLIAIAVVARLLTRTR
jgi:hypothetical protein